MCTRTMYIAVAFKQTYVGGRERRPARCDTGQMLDVCRREEDAAAAVGVVRFLLLLVRRVLVELLLTLYQDRLLEEVLCVQVQSTCTSYTHVHLHRLYLSIR